MTDDTGTTEGQAPSTSQATDVTPTQDVQDTQHLQQPTQPQDAERTEDETSKEQDEEWDKDRAKRTIDKLRQFERDAEKRLKAQEKQLSEYQKREREAELAKLSEMDRLKAELSQRDAELQFERQQARDRMNRYEVQRAAAKLDIIDPDAAVKLLDWGRLEYDDDGSPTNVEDALRDLVRDRSYLVRQPSAPAAPVSPTNPATRQPAPGQQTYYESQLNDFAFFNKHADDIALAYREGRILKG